MLPTGVELKSSMRKSKYLLNETFIYWHQLVPTQFFIKSVITYLVGLNLVEATLKYARLYNIYQQKC